MGDLLSRDRSLLSRDREGAVALTALGCRTAPPLPYGRGSEGRGSEGDGRAGDGRRGQATVEFAVLYAGVILPLTFMLIFVAEMLWVWHSVADFTRLGARYASTHCWQNGSENVLQWMRTHVPRMIDMEQFQNSTAELEVRYFSRDATSGSLVDFTCEGGDCTSDCVPDVVSVRVASYEFRHFTSFFGLPPVRIPDFRMSLPMESAGCDPEAATCSP
ncbi:MAG: TadE family protein [Bryobacteraceae bacterium]